jgi:signal transduction histidine kinase
MSEKLTVHKNNFKNTYKNKYKREKIKTNILSGLIFFCSISAPMSFSFLIQQKINAVAAFSVGLSFVFILLILAYFRSSSLKNLEQSYSEVRTGMKVKKKQSASMYEVVQESHNFFYLKDTLDNKKMMISKEKLRSDFELEL